MNSLVRLVVILLLAALPAAADTIVLKSGRRLQAWNVQERGERYYYETPEGEVSLRKDQVERIERDDARPDWGRAAVSLADLPAADLPALDDADVLRVVAGGQVDSALLAKLEGEAARGDEAARLRAAAALALVGRLHLEQGRRDPAAESFRRALTFAPNHPGLLLMLAVAEIERQRYAAAQEALRPLFSNKDYAFHAYRLQGFLYYATEEMDRALAAWKQALALKPDPALAAELKAIEQEARAAEDLAQRASGRFVLRYEGSERGSERLAGGILRALDGMYDQFGSAFNYLPREPIIVLLYPDERFYELTGMPPEVHGLYDGKIRVPVAGLSSLTPSLEQVLRHELVHAFVFHKTRGRARHWLQEGLAQYYAGQRPQVSGDVFRPLFEPRDGSALPRIEAAFGDAGSIFAAYAASWLVVDVLMRRYGRGDMERLLDALERGESTEQALRSAFRLTFVDLDREVYDSLR